MAHHLNARVIERARRVLEILDVSESPRPMTQDQEAALTDLICKHYPMASKTSHKGLFLLHNGGGDANDWSDVAQVSKGPQKKWEVVCYRGVLDQQDDANAERGPKLVLSGISHAPDRFKMLTAAAPPASTLPASSRMDVLCAIEPPKGGVADTDIGGASSITPVVAGAGDQVGLHKFSLKRSLSASDSELSGAPAGSSLLPNPVASNVSEPGQTCRRAHNPKCPSRRLEPKYRLYQAARDGCLECTAKRLRSGEVDPCAASDTQGWTVKNMAVECKHTHIVDFLNIHYPNIPTKNA